jgi:alpha-galactosidase
VHDELATLVGKPAMPLPPDNTVSASVPAIPVQPIRSLAAEKTTLQAKVERINGIYLDRLDPVSAQQGWGILHRNASVTGDSLSIGGRRFLRGIGTHAVARIVYDLNGRYKALHGLAGHHDTTGGSLTMAIEADGKRVWESGPLQKDNPAKAFDISLVGARQLILIAGDAGDNYMGDHADWADTWLEFADGATTRAAQ